MSDPTGLAMRPWVLGELERRITLARRAGALRPPPWGAARELGQDLHFGSMQLTQIHYGPPPGEGGWRQSLFAVAGLPVEVARFMAGNDPGVMERAWSRLLAEVESHRVSGVESFVCRQCGERLERMNDGCAFVRDVAAMLGYDQ